MHEERERLAARGIIFPVLVPTDFSGLIFNGAVADIPPPQLHPARVSLYAGLNLVLQEAHEPNIRLGLRQEPSPGRQPYVSQVPNLIEERDLLIQGVPGRLARGGPFPYEPIGMIRLTWVREGIAYTVNA